MHSAIIGDVRVLPLPPLPQKKSWVYTDMGRETTTAVTKDLIVLREFPHLSKNLLTDLLVNEHCKNLGGQSPPFCLCYQSHQLPIWCAVGDKVVGSTHLCFTVNQVFACELTCYCMYLIEEPEHYCDMGIQFWHSYVQYSK